MTNEELVLRIQSGEDTAQNMELLYNQVRWFIHAIAWKYRGSGELEDLEQEGYLALYPAIDGYNPDLGVKFLTYAEKWIRQRMGRYLRIACCSIGLSAHCQENIRKYERFCNTFRLENGSEPSDKDTANCLGISTEQVWDIRRNASSSHVSSLDSQVLGLEGEDITLGDVVASAENLEEDILEESYQEELKRELWDCVDSLGGRQPEVLRMHYQEEMTFSMIGQKYGTTPEAVRQIEAKALRELRKPRYNKRLRPFLPEALEAQAYHHIGVGEFNRTWESSTERVALKLFGR